MSSSEISAMVTDSWDRHERSMAEENRRTVARAQLAEERNPSRKCMHRFFRMISFLSGCSAFLMGAGQIVGMTFEDDNLDVISYLFRGYVMALCVLVVFNEMEFTSLVKNSSILRYWITRGLFYSFVGVIGIQQNDRVSDDPSLVEHRSASLRFIKVVALLMVGAGCLYFGMGILCLQIYYNRLRRDYEERRGRAIHIRNATDRLTEAGSPV